MSKHYTLGRTCSDCDGPISNHNKSGACKPCNLKRVNSDPTIKQRAVNGLRHRLNTDPVVRANRRAALVKARAARDGDKLRERARKMMAMMHTPEIDARRRDALRQALKDKPRNPWCPPEYRDAYRKMVRHRRFTAAEAKKIILDQVAADKRKALAALSPFERQQRALERGAKLVANDTGSSLSNPANYGEERWSYGR